LVRDPASPGIFMTLHFHRTYGSNPVTTGRPGPAGLTEYAFWRGTDLMHVAGFGLCGSPAETLLRAPDDATPGTVRLVVPWAAWESGDGFRSDWWLAGAAGGWTAEEAKLRSKRDDALRRALGF